MALEKRILEQLSRLAPSRQQEVLDFAEFLASKPAVSNSGGPSTWPVGFLDRVLGGWQGEPLQRAPQGDFESRQDLA